MSNNALINYNIQDEYYTPKCMVDMIIPYINKDNIVWGPLDTDKSEFVLVLKKNGNKVIHSHLRENKDFLKYTPKDKFDIIISNPPFTLKNKVFQKVHDLNIPYALIMGLHCLSYYEFAMNFHNKKLQLLIPAKRISFNGNVAIFTSVYFCEKLLPQDIIIIDNFENDNSKSRFVKSRMELEDMKFKEKQLTFDMEAK